VPARTSKKFEILRRRRQIAELFVERHTQVAIAEMLGISQATVSADI
jgi:predicted transcriptional regulator